jgi:predicted phosphodiesterase
MTRIHILSDLHLEFEPLAIPATDADVIVLAGDIGLKAHGVEWANDTFKVPVVYVLGNHEFYGGQIDRVLAKCRATAAPHVHVLEQEAVTIAGLRFLGCTLWTDFALFGEHRHIVGMLDAQRVMTDFQRIRIKKGDRYPKFSPGYSVVLHRAARQWLAAELATADAGHTVVVTHHAPHRGSLAPEFEHDLLSSAYVSDLSPLMGSVPLWIHGHTHTSFDYSVGSTRVICNPRGYAPMQPNDAFDASLVVEIA